jgi:hypothetical protein
MWKLCWLSLEDARPHASTRQHSNARDYGSAEHIHPILDPLWKRTKWKPKAKGQRRKIYAEISKRIGKEYHTGEIASVEEAREVYKIVREIGGAISL